MILDGRTLNITRLYDNIKILAIEEYMTASERYESSKKGKARKMAWWLRRSPEQIEKDKEANRIAAQRYREQQKLKKQT